MTIYWWMKQWYHLADLVNHLNNFGLTAKPPESLEGGAAFGLRLHMDKAGNLVFARGNDLPEGHEEMSRCELFSACGKMVGHYPISGWLRIACSYLKRRTEEINWEDVVDSETTGVVQEVVEEVQHHDPVQGRWHVPKLEKGVVWCNASSMATDVCIEIDGVIVEDAVWLRKKCDYNHINVAELDTMIKGVNIVLKCGLKEIEIQTDSVTVRSWISFMIMDEKRIRTKGAAELIIMRCLGILREMID